MSPAFRVAVVTLLWLASGGSLSAYTSVRVAFDSNVLVDDKRVIFAQGTGSLTVLNLDTGEVLLRKKPDSNFEYSGNLQLTGQGVLMTSYGRIVFLDRNTFAPVWRAEHCYGAVLDGEHVVSHDGNHSVTCRSVQSGQVSWKIDMEGGWHLSAANGKVLVATPDYSHRPPTLLVFDLKSGDRILRHDASSDVRWHQVYFDGRLIYLVEDGSAESHRASGRPLRVKMLDLEGKVVAEADHTSPKVVANASRENAAFIWGEKYFNGGQVQQVNPHERATLANLWEEGDESRDEREGDRESFRGRHHLPKLLASGIFVTTSSRDADIAVGQVLRLIKPKGLWVAYAPYLGEYGLISHVAEADGKLLLGSSEGQLECLDSETGRSRWLYTFPVIRQTMSYSSRHGMPPYLTEQAAEYRRGLEQTGNLSGSIRLPSDIQPASTRWAKLRAETDYPGRIVIDPSPDDPFHKLGRYVTWLAICAALPVAGVLVLVLARLARRKRPKQTLPSVPHDETPPSVGLAAWFLVLSVSPAYGLLEYGRVSHSWTIALKIIFALTISVAVSGTIRLCYARRWLAAFLFSVILIGCFFLMLNPIRFA
ncbi:PQQ-binding-like beta-propeller repeat protein [Gemmata sp. G18]|uniref:PQQ-binding-like beta-propeller repeat protein n=1 Tax=Gemmata palustris TaxID=2822762 RepID=A0ABS5BM89_9BACT|nr:PQQ-binding-like beta-propeller repeat protein [Gemmata palustris]MBP3954814.1 PQQ-binding-like beta-propeller repeat protein [Gemmata palustris]